MRPSSYILFVRKISGSGMSEYNIRKRFMKEVDKGDYDKTDMEDIFKCLYKVAKKTAQ